jgi:hypothetical protein
LNKKLKFWQVFSGILATSLITGLIIRGASK